MSDLANAAEGGAVKLGGSNRPAETPGTAHSARQPAAP